MNDAGLFGPGSATWRVNGEAAMIVGGGRALVMQVAHPQVGAGVERWSRYKADRWRRLTHTLDTMAAILFADEATALAAAARTRAAHRRIEGRVVEGPSAGTPYQARDPALILWVWATLVDTSLLVYDGWVEPLSAAEQERYYQEQKRFAEACGVPADACPATLADFRRYVERTVAETLEATPAAHTVCEIVLDPLQLPQAAAPLNELLRLPTAGLLPPALRERLGIDWSPGRERALRGCAAASRRLLPLLPDRARRVRSARAASERVA